MFLKLKNRKSGSNSLVFRLNLRLDFLTLGVVGCKNLTQTVWTQFKSGIFALSQKVDFMSFGRIGVGLINLNFVRGGPFSCFLSFHDSTH